MLTKDIVKFSDLVQYANDIIELSNLMNKIKTDNSILHYIGISCIICKFDNDGFDYAFDYTAETFMNLCFYELDEINNSWCSFNNKSLVKYYIFYSSDDDDSLQLRSASETGPMSNVDGLTILSPSDCTEEMYEQMKYIHSEYYVNILMISSMLYWNSPNQVCYLEHPEINIGSLISTIMGLLK